MSENGEIYTTGNKFYTAASTDGMDKFHLWPHPIQPSDIYDMKELNRPKIDLSRPPMTTNDSTAYQLFL